MTTEQFNTEDVIKKTIAVGCWLLSYSKQSQIAQESPLFYDLMMGYGKSILEAFAIVPDDDPSKWFWQLSLFGDKRYSRKTQVGWLKKTCETNPSQWEGVSEHSSPIYIRYRFGHLTCSIAGVQVYAQTIGDDLDGALSDTEMQKHLANDLDFDDIEWEMSN